MDWLWVLVVATALLVFTRWWRQGEPADAPAPLAKFKIGDVTLETLQLYVGYDYARPILVAIKGKVYDVTPAAAEYGPGKPLHAYAGNEVALALAKASTAAEDVGSDVTHDLGKEAADRLAEAVAQFDSKYDVVGQVVPLKELTLTELAAYDGVAQPGGPLYLAVQGMVFDVSKGNQFYGPDGVYPFAGKECARALALMSTDLSDCNDRLDDLGYVEKENLREWAGKFRYKYPVVGRVRPAPPAAAAS